MARFIMLTLADGTVVDGILLTPAADSGEGAANQLVIPMDRGSGVGAVVEATVGADQDSFTQVA